MNTFDVLGVPPLLGRTTAAADALANAEPVAILGYKFWQRQFAGDPGVVGRQMRLNDKMRTVVGVMPPRFMWRGADIYLPVVFHSGEVIEGVTDVHVLGRLKPGVGAAQAEADLKPIIEELQHRQPGEFPETWRVGLLSFKETFPSDIREALWILFGAVGNAAVDRMRECVESSAVKGGHAEKRDCGAGFAGRQPVAPDRAAIVGEPDFGAGGRRAWDRVGVCGPRWYYRDGAAEHHSRRGAYRAQHTGSAVHYRGFGFIGFALRPCTRAACFGRRSCESSKTDGPRLNGRPPSSILAQCSGDWRSGACADPAGGRKPDDPDVVRNAISESGDSRGSGIDVAHYPDAARRNAFLQEVLGRIQAIPGVAAVGLNSGLHPLGAWGVQVEVVGNSRQDSRNVLVHQTNNGYTNAMGIRLIQGRQFSDQEVARGSHMAMVNQSFVRRYISGGDPVGRMVRIPRFRKAPMNLADDSFQIVGVTKDALNRISTNETLPELYVPFTIAGLADRLVVLAQGAPLALANSIRAQVYSVDRDQPVMEVKTMDTLLNEWVYARPRFNLLLFTVFAAFGMILAVFGVYGVISNSVSQRTQEIGIRIALGARVPDVLTMILMSGAKLVGLGILIGLAGSLFCVRFLSGQVWNISTFDPYSFGAVSLILFVAGLFAAFWPARRAALVDPVTALRQE